MNTVADVIGNIESAHNPAALRFEPLTYESAPYYGAVIDAIKECNLCSIETARMIYSTSWGEFQIMGMNLYDSRVCAYRNNIARYLVQSGDQFVTFDSFLFRMPLGVKLKSDSPSSLFSDPNLRAHFARLYNGPEDFQEYADKIKAELNAT